MLVFLLGFMGSGKTTLGEQLAHQLGVGFSDLDQMIEKKEQKTVAEIFSTKGEEYFRKIENQVLCSLKSTENLVVATGGGAPCFFNNMDIMNASGETIYLKVPSNTLVNRLKPGMEKRPLLAGKSDTGLQSFIESKLAEREPFYSKSKHIIEGSFITVQDILTLVFDKKY